MKSLLIISPYFPPSNAADMHRVRMSLPYFKNLGWEVELVTVNENYSDFVKDPLLEKSIPAGIKIHKVKAFSKKWTSKFGLGSLALRSLLFYKKEVNQLLKNKKFDLIYFSTTQFPVCILGAYWKKKFNIPYVIDMQDPWHSEYYQDKPKTERPKKHWFSYRLNKFLEPIAMSSVSAIISVSDKYIDTLTDRYPRIKNVPTEVIPFGFFAVDFQITNENNHTLELSFDTSNKRTNLVYVGRGGLDMHPALIILFNIINKGLTVAPKLFNSIHLHFIGTSYAPKGKGIPSILPLAKEMNLEEQVTEYTDRIGFYESLKNLQAASGLIVISSDDLSYSASKLYPYVFANKQLLAIINTKSPGAKILKFCNAAIIIDFADQTELAFEKFSDFILKISSNQPPETNWKNFEAYTASNLTMKQVAIFNKIIQ